MDSEAKTIIDGLPLHPRQFASGCFDGCFVEGTKVYKAVRDGQIFVSIYLTDGGWIGAPAMSFVGDLAPFCD